jgi:hypothetical protein
VTPQAAGRLRQLFGALEFRRLVPRLEALAAADRSGVDE